MPRPNRLREKLQAGAPTVGTRLSSQWPTVVELAGLAGTIDYVEFLAEYAPFDSFSLENVGRAVDLFPNLSSMIKVPQELRAFTAVQALKSGIQNVLFADCRTAADVAECVAIVRAESPTSGGLRGVSMSRDMGVVLEVGSAAYVQATIDTVVAIMIEKKSAVEDLTQLLATPGVDMVQFGPADYAMSIGLAGQWDHPAIKEAERFVIETALRHKVQPRAEILQPGEADYYVNLGVRHFSLGADVETLFNYYRDQGAALRAMLSG